VAVGYSANGATEETLVESWNGASWSVSRSPDPSSVLDQLGAVSCQARSGCVAVGEAAGFPGQELIETDISGGSWTAAQSPTLGSEDVLASVSCPSRHSCVAVGYYVDAEARSEPLIESWTGASWSVDPTPHLADSEGARLTGVTCLAASHCIAVGSRVNGSTDETLIASWDGKSWSVVPSPDRGTGNNHLLGVACSRPSFCTAVGEYAHGPHFAFAPLTEAWNGVSWYVTPSADLGANGQLRAVSCASATRCVAVGSFTKDATANTLVESWSGFTKDTAADTLVESWNGFNWSLSPDIGSNGAHGELNAVSCTGSARCVAVGNSDDSSGWPHPLVATMSGRRWSTAAIAAGGRLGVLDGVTCFGSVGCVATGAITDGTTPAALIEVESAHRWSTRPTPPPISSPSRLDGISCPAASTCVAVGYFVLGLNPQTLVESGGMLG
jgi:hypothetical protein